MPEFDLYANFDPAMPLGPNEASDDPLSTASGGGLQSYVDGFWSLVSQIKRETEQGMIFARPDTSPPPPSSSSASTPPGGARLYSPYSSHPNSPTDAPFNPYEGYNHYFAVQQYQPEEDRVRMLGRYVRRMPTIDSLGSHEMGSSAAHSGAHQPQRAEPGSPGNDSRRVSTYSTLSSAGSSRLSAYFTNLGHPSVGGQGQGRVSGDSEWTASFHTAVSAVPGSPPLPPSPTSPSSSSSQPPPLPPKDPPLAHIL